MTDEPEQADQDESKRQDINIGVQGNVDGELNVAGHDIIQQRYEQETIIQKLPLPVVIGGLGALAVGLIVVVFFVLRGQQASSQQVANQVSETVNQGQATTAAGLDTVGQGIGEANQSLQTLAAPTATPKPPFEPAAEGEMLVVVPDFTGTQGATAATRIYRALTDRVSSLSLSHVRVERLDGVAPEVRDDALAISDKYNATLVIWGTADDYAFEPFFEIKEPEQSIIKGSEENPLPSLGTTLNTDLPTFTAYVVEGAPNDFEYLMLFSLGQITLLSGNAEQSIPLLQEAAQSEISGSNSDANRAIVYFYLGLAEGYLGYKNQDVDQLNQSIDDLNQAIQLDPQLYTAYNNRGYVNLLLGNADQALADFSQSIEINPNYVRAYNNRAYIYLEVTKDLQAALDDANKAIELDPTNALAYNNRGTAYQYMGDLDKAIPDYNQAIQLDPATPLYYASRGLAYAEQGNTQAAVDDLNQYLDLAPDTDPLYSYIQGQKDTLLGTPTAAP